MHRSSLKWAMNGDDGPESSPAVENHWSTRRRRGQRKQITLDLRSWCDEDPEDLLGSADTWRPRSSTHQELLSGSFTPDPDPPKLRIISAKHTADQSSGETVDGIFCCCCCKSSNFCLTRSCTVHGEQNKKKHQSQKKVKAAAAAAAQTSCN